MGLKLKQGNKPVGWRNDSMEHGLAAKGIKSGRKDRVLVVPISAPGTPMKSYPVKVAKARQLGLIDKNNNLTKKGEKDLKKAKFIDTDGDGVPDIVDCEPLNPKKHGLIEGLKTGVKEAVGMIPGVGVTGSVIRTAKAFSD